MSDQLSRRNFIQTGTALVAGAALASSRAYGANERIRVGVIGTDNRGGQLIEALLPHTDAEIVALCEVHTPPMEKWAARLDTVKDKYGDYRKMLERDDIDAVLIATPDHWHALQCTDACAAGKDVFVEKPLSQTIVEGRKMIEAARKHERIVQVGLHRRSSTLYADLREKIKQDYIGKVTVGRAYHVSNMWPNGIGRAKPSAPPAELNWDMWLGPREMREYQENICPYKFRWWKGYSSQLGNQGVHFFDLIRWMLDEDAPASVTALGGKYAVDDDRTIPDTVECVFEFASGRLLIFGQYEASGYPILPKGVAELRGTKGVAYLGDSKVEIMPEKGGQFQDKEPRMKAETLEATGSNGELTTAHMRNFLDCIKSRQRPNCDVEDGHKSTIFCHLANIALETRSRIEWDAASEKITSPDSANEHLHYEYRAPWKLA